MAQTMQDLLSQYTKYIKPDTRVFSQDVMPYQDFTQPFTEWGKQFVEQQMRPEFLRYEYNPYVENVNRQLGSLAQSQGLSGAWRTSQATSDIDRVAREAMLGTEQLQKGFSGQALEAQDLLLSGWADPLYQSRLTNFYEAPFRNLNLGGVAPTMTPSSASGIKGFTPTILNRISGKGGQKASPITAGGVQTPPTIQQADRRLIGQYLKKPGASGANPYDILRSY